MVRERRKHARVRARGVAAHVRAPDREFSCPVENVSEGGVFLGTDQLLPVGTVVTLELAKPGLRRTIHLEGAVAAALPGAEARPGMGIAFAEMTAEAKARLLLLLREMGAPISINLRAVQKVLAAPGDAEEKRPWQKATPPLRGALEPLCSSAASPGGPDPERLRAQLEQLDSEVDELKRRLRDREAEAERLRSLLAAVARDAPGHRG